MDCLKLVQTIVCYTMINVVLMKHYNANKSRFCKKSKKLKRGKIKVESNLLLKCGKRHWKSNIRFIKKKLNTVVCTVVYNPH